MSDCGERRHQHGNRYRSGGTAARLQPEDTASVAGASGPALAPSESQRRRPQVPAEGRGRQQGLWQRRQMRRPPPVTKRPLGGKKGMRERAAGLPCRCQGRFGFCLREDDAPPGRPSPQTARPPQAGAPAQPDPHSRSRRPQSVAGEKGRMCRDTATGLAPGPSFHGLSPPPAPPAKPFGSNE